LTHYYDNIKNFGAPNGLCSSITESKHIIAVKRPWRRSSRYKALFQILRVNERLDKLAAARADFTTRGLLANPPLVATILDVFTLNNDDDDGVSQDSDGESINSGNISPNNNGNTTSNNEHHEDNNDAGEEVNDDDDDDDEAGPVESQSLMNEVRLAQEKGE
jgi:hypothetical protein